jgi:hypothetical protein
MVGGHFAVGCARLLHESSPLEDHETHHGANSHILSLLKVGKHCWHVRDRADEKEVNIERNDGKT